MSSASDMFETAKSNQPQNEPKAPDGGVQGPPEETDTANRLAACKAALEGFVKGDAISPPKNVCTLPDGPPAGLPGGAASARPSPSR
jgi:hypothetical protein